MKKDLIAAAAAAAAPKPFMNLTRSFSRFSRDLSLLLCQFVVLLYDGSTLASPPPFLTFPPPPPQHTH